MAVDYVAWVKDALRRNPHLSQSGLARHLNRDRAVISLMLQGKREIKARELDLIEAYLGEPRPDRQGVAAPAVAIVGRIGAAWYEAGEAPEVDNGRVSPVLSRTDMRQVAYRLDRPMMGWPAGSGIVEADETYHGKVDDPSTTRTDGTPYLKGGKRGPANKRAILSLVERGGDVRSFHIARADKETVSEIVGTNVAKEAMLVTDESRLYGSTHEDHQSVRHAADEYVRGLVHTNTVEGYFSIFKRGMKGVYQHCSEKHLHRYLAEFDFRYNNRIARGVNDEARATRMVKGVVGKRLTYQTTREGAE